MTTPPVWVSDLADRFWDRAGRPVLPFPRDLEPTVTNAVLLSIVDRPGLRLSTVADYLRRLGWPLAVAEPDRALRAALSCWQGGGFLFLDATDPPDERRFSVAHELAHFLRDYDGPRQQVVRALGPAALAVLDGFRPPTDDERLHAVLRNRPLAPHVHLMSRDPDGRPRGDDEREAEESADRLAFELLAPAELLRDSTGGDSLTSRLIEEFSLPPIQARLYAHFLLPVGPPSGSIVERLRKFG